MCLFAALAFAVAVDVVQSLDVARASSARTAPPQPSRRALLQAAPCAAFAAAPRRALAADAALDRARAARLALDAVPPLLEAQEWDKARSVLKASPVAELWNLGNVCHRRPIVASGTQMVDTCGHFRRRTTSARPFWMPATRTSSSSRRTSPRRCS
jgi:hypothetical protein